MTKSNLNKIYTKTQPYRRYWKENSNPRKLINYTRKTQAIDNFTPAKPKDRHIATPTYTHTSTTTNTNKIIEINNHWSLISLNTKGLNSPKIKKNTWVNRLCTKTGSNILVHTRNTLHHQKQTLTQSKRVKKDFPNGPKKQAGKAILSSRTEFQPKLIKGDGEGHFTFNSPR